MIRLLLLLLPFALAAPVRGQSCHVVGGARDTIAQVIRVFEQAGSYSAGLLQAFQLLEGVKYGGGGAGCPYDKTLVNCRELDCVTFVETVLAAARAGERGRQSAVLLNNDKLFEHYLGALNQLRYYNSEVDGRSQRITYFTDAMRLQCAYGFCQDVGQLAHADTFSKRIHYMTSNPGSFRGTPNWDDVRQRETTLSNSPRFYFPLQYNADSTDLDLTRLLAAAQHGDVVGLTTNVPGLDVSHVGFLTVRNGELCFTHASFVKKQVVLEQPLKDYLLTRSTITGLVVFRPVPQ